MTQATELSCPHPLGLTGIGHRTQLTGAAPGSAQRATAGRKEDGNPDLSTAGNTTAPSVVHIKKTVSELGV